MRVLTFLLLIVCAATQMTVSAKDDKKKSPSELAAISGGVVYALPRTGIKIEVEADQEILVHGPYFAFAQKYLGINDVPKVDEENWTITNIRMDTFGDPDPAAVYKATGSTATLLSLSEEGIMIGINSGVKPEAGKVITNVFPMRPSTTPNEWNELSMHSFLAEKDSTKKSGSNFKTFEEKAAEAAADIVKYRKRKASILAAKDDKFLPDGEAYKTMITGLNKIIDDYVALFTGRKLHRLHHFSFEVVPDGKIGKALVAFRFSTTAGVLPVSNVSGKPIMLELEPNSELKQKIESTVTPEITTSGIYYRIPVVTQVRLLNGSDILARATMNIAQFGIITGLSDGLLNGEYSIEFYPTTGAIRRIGTK
ncbi:MAG: DUF4831 family protein [Prolixibacteraceae bacterium]